MRRTYTSSYDSEYLNNCNKYSKDLRIRNTYKAYIQYIFFKKLESVSVKDE